MLIPVKLPAGGERAGYEQNPYGCEHPGTITCCACHTANKQERIQIREVAEDQTV